MPEETPSKHDFTQVVEIAQIQLSHLNNGAHFQFMKNVSDRLATDTKIKENAVGQAAIKALTEALAAEDKYLVLSQKSLLTDEISKADRERDMLFAGYRTAVKGFLNMPVADLAKHAHQLWQHLVDYAIDPKMQLERETGLITNLCTDLAGEYATQVQALGLKPYVDARVGYAIPVNGTDVSGGAFLGLTTGAEINRWMFGLGYQGVWMSRNQHNEFSSSASDMETKGFTVRVGYRF